MSDLLLGLGMSDLATTGLVPGLEFEEGRLRRIEVGQGKLVLQRQAGGGGSGSANLCLAIGGEGKEKDEWQRVRKAKAS